MKINFYIVVMALLLSEFPVFASGALDADNAECGTNQTGIANRIQDCTRLSNHQVSAYNEYNSQTILWNLVARQQDPTNTRVNEVWQDSFTGMLWGDVMDGEYTFDNAVEVDEWDKVVGEKACAPTNDPNQALIAMRANAGVNEKNWGLPTMSEVAAAYRDGAWTLPNRPDNWFWSASFDPDGVSIQTFNGASGEPFDMNRNGTQFVRCIGR